MGLFDWITFEGTLPNGETGKQDQTAEFICAMVHHKIDADGRIWEANLKNGWDEEKDASMLDFEENKTFTGVLSIEPFELHYLRGKLMGFLHEQTDEWTPFGEQQ